MVLQEVRRKDGWGNDIQRSNIYIHGTETRELDMNQQQPWKNELLELQQKQGLHPEEYVADRQIYDETSAFIQTQITKAKQEERDKVWDHIESLKNPFSEDADFPSWAAYDRALIAIKLYLTDRPDTTPQDPA